MARTVSKSSPKSDLIPCLAQTVLLQYMMGSKMS